MNLLWLAVLGSLAVRLLAGRWPWQLWQESERARTATRARNLLGVSAKAGRDEIIEAHKRLLGQVHPDRGGTSEAVHEANAARDLLLARIVQRQ
ncbi:molecular chaperone DnaJ [Novosphingobium sp. Chol11]|uniref:molecular chaperone DnaJ n=1 Tax=Novosphingobium sp. Chol11 TaxID=1385763 RepID=UPI0025DF2EAD|nr:molecular chaperone DnaJ [Novosphingobium sp. Chol11]